MARIARSRPPVKQCSTAGKAPFPLSSVRIRAMSASQSREWMTSGRPVSRAAAMCCAEALRLRVARAIVVVIVEPGFADRHDFRMLRQRDQIARASMSSSSCALCGWVPTEQNTSGNRLGDREHLRVLSAPASRSSPCGRCRRRARARRRRRARRRNPENRDGSGCRPAWSWRLCSSAPT